MTADPSKRTQPVNEEAASLAALMAEARETPATYEVVEPEKPKRKRKPKPQMTLQIPYSLVVGVAALLIGFMVASMIALVPTHQTSSVVISQPVEQSVQIEANPLSNPSDSLVDRWMVLPQPIGEIEGGSFVRVLSQDDTPEFYNVADMQGHLAIVQAGDLAAASQTPSESVYPPPGPYSAALGKTQKLLETVEWNGDLPAGTQVYAMGWRVEDGMWVYEVSPDRVKIYYLPALHLTWAAGVHPTS